MGIFKKKKAKDEAAVTAVAPVQSVGAERPSDEEFNEIKPAKKKGFLRSIPDIVDTAKGLKTSVDEIYGTWIKPIMDNRVQIKRRWNALVTAISVIFFLLYVPILLFSKIAKGLSLGWDIALYTCIGVYLLAVIVMIIITVASGRSTNTETSKRWRKASSLILFIVRLASLAISITAIIISGNGESTALDAILMVLAIVSIVFTTLSLIFGGAVGFVKWLISPAKIKRTFSFVLLEWYQILSDVNSKDKNFKSAKKISKKYIGEVSRVINDGLIPALGKKYIHTIDEEDLSELLASVQPEEKPLVGWVLSNAFEYAVNCGYVSANPCAAMEMDTDISAFKPAKAVKDDARPSASERFLSIFRKK